MACHSGAQLARGIVMGKISIVSRRRREKRFPETEALRRARVRELSPVDILPPLQAGGGEDHPGPGEENIVDYSAALLDDLVAMALPEVTSALANTEDDLTGINPVEPDTTVRLDLNPEQSQAIAALSLLANAQHQPLMLDLQEWHEQQRIVLQFSLHTETVPEMLSLQELCQQLKVGRRSVMRLIRDRKLRCYRIGKRYRFAASEVKHYLEQNSSQGL
jgi:excisionase family DNA binding protein